MCKSGRKGKNPETLFDKMPSVAMAAIVLLSITTKAKMMSDVRQTALGRNSTNQLTYVTNTVSAPSNEIKTLVAIIDSLSKDVDAKGEQSIRKKKDFSQKFFLRFGDYLDTIQFVYFENLKPRYDELYPQAVEASDASEIRLGDIATLIAIKSDECLSETGGDPLKAIDLLMKWLMAEVGSALVVEKNFQYSEGAVRYYIYKQFELCNVFPNKGNDE
jgi:hypothetical protein